MSLPKYDWAAISQEYIEAPTDSARPTLKQLAEKYDISFGYIQQVAAKENWRGRSQKFLREVEVKRRETVVKTMAKKHTRIDAVSLELTSALLNRIAGTIQEQATLKPSDISNMASALKVLYELSLSMRGDLLQALTQLANQGMIPQNAINQIAQVLSESDRNLQQTFQRILQGNCPD